MVEDTRVVVDLEMALGFTKKEQEGVECGYKDSWVWLSQFIKMGTEFLDTPLSVSITQLKHSIWNLTVFFSESKIGVIVKFSQYFFKASVLTQFQYIFFICNIQWFRFMYNWVCIL